MPQDQPTALELAYSPSSMIDDIAPFLDSYASKSATTRRSIPPVTLRYGDAADELIDVFGAEQWGRLHVFFHGGYWQQLSRGDASFPAAGFTERGVGYAAPEYTLAPGLSLEGIVDQSRRAIARLSAVFEQRAGRRPSIIVSGSSAGAHLAAMVMLTDWAEHGLAQAPVDGAVLVSGVYDLRPLVDTYINDAVGLSGASAWELSPARIVTTRTIDMPVLVAVGEIETEAFKSQSAEFAWLCEQSGAEVTTVEVSARNHFDIVHDLSDPASELGAAVVDVEHRSGWHG